MFVSKNKYQKMVALAATLRAELIATKQVAEEAIRLAAEFYDKAQQQRTHTTVPQFNEDQLRELLQLVHPDKHGGKLSAIRMTQHINALREK